MKRKCTIIGCLLIIGCSSSFCQSQKGANLAEDIRTIDISNDSLRHVIVAQGTPEVYQGHPTTVLLPDGKTMYCVWTYDHGGVCGPVKRSDDGGLTWSELLEMPQNWSMVYNCPTIYRLPDPQGSHRLFVFAGEGPSGSMYQSYSDNDGETWSPMAPNATGPSVMPFCTIMPIDGGKRLIGLSNIRRPGEQEEERSNVLSRSYSADGGATWTPWEIILDIPGLKPCEPELVRSPDGKQLLCLIRENVKRVALFMTSDDEGATWSDPKSLPAPLHGDRHKAKYARDGRLVVVFRDTGYDNLTRTHFVGWVGTYDDILLGNEGQYRVKLLHSHKGMDCGYPGIELLPNETFIATTYVKYSEGPEQNSVVSTRFKLAELDNKK